MSRPAKFSLIAAFRCAGRGVLLLAKGRNARLQLSAGMIALLLGFALRISPAEWIAVVLSAALVLSLEASNTALERLVDIASPDYDELARDAKDLSAGAVLIASAASVVVGLIIFLPRVLNLLKQ